LRRMDYVPDPDTGFLTPEYVDIYGIPFSVIPFKGRSTSKPPVDPPPKSHVQAIEERAAMEIRFPIVEGYSFALRKNLVRCNLEKVQPIRLEPGETPTAVFVKPQVGYQLGNPALGGFAAEEANREEFYKSTHLQTIKFIIAQGIIWNLTEGTGAMEPKLRMRSRHQLFPQIYRIVDQFVRRKVDFRGCHECELGMKMYVDQAVERLTNAIEPDEEQGEPPLLPILNRYKPIGSTSEVNFKTTRPVYPTEASHVNQVVLDTDRWERSAAYQIESAAKRGMVQFYVRNDHLEFTIPYDFYGNPHHYTPDFVIRFADNRTLMLEIKGFEDEQDRAKHQAAQRWVSAVNNWRQLGQWEFHVCKDVALLARELEFLSSQGTEQNGTGARGDEVAEVYQE